ncbi:MAG: 50S ribosomal protein L30 [Candidatus Cloacimonadota bacterium]|nr:MAG: 50S ribosomal protein L30 [Candidatus Cloacimonadota bacterium]
MRVTQIKSRIGSSKRQCANLDALGLHKLNDSRDHEVKPEITGMINKVAHLVKVEEI